MAQKHELMAKLQAAKQCSSKIVETESQKAYPEIQEPAEMANTTQGGLDFPADTTSALPDAPLPAEAPALIPPPANGLEEEAVKEQKKEHEKICYTTISVPKQYGQKAKLYATFLNLNMVEFTCGALDTYILQLQEAGKLPRVNL